MESVFPRYARLSRRAGVLLGELLPGHQELEAERGGHGVHQGARPAAVLGSVAAVISLTQCVLGLLLTAAGVAYLLLAPALAGAVYLSGPLLLAWITAPGCWLTVTARRTAETW